MKIGLGWDRFRIVFFFTLCLLVSVPLQSRPNSQQQWLWVGLESGELRMLPIGTTLSLSSSEKLSLGAAINCILQEKRSIFVGLENGKMVIFNASTGEKVGTDHCVCLCLCTCWRCVCGYLADTVALHVQVCTVIYCIVGREATILHKTIRMCYNREMWLMTVTCVLIGSNDW